MRSGRYVVLGLANPRAEWFPRVSQWANSAALPVEFVKCVSADELRARLTSGRPFSVMLLDGSLPAVDRDLLALSAERACPAIIVEDDRVVREWRALGAAWTLPRSFERAALLDALMSVARPLTLTELAIDAPGVAEQPPPWRGTLVVVTGPGGTGASTTAIALAQGLASDVRYGRSVLLADFCLRSDHAMLHDTKEVAPGVQELAEAHRTGRPSASDVRALAFEIPERGYELLLGLRRARFWTTIRPIAFRAALRSLVTTYRVVVADVDADFEGEEDSGSVDVEERNAMARATLDAADVVVVVAEPSMKGLHALGRVLADLQERHVEPGRVLPLFTRAPRSPRQRALYSAALANLTASTAFGASPVFVPDRPIDQILQVGARLPGAIVDPVVGAVHALLARTPVVPPKETPPERVVPGSLGRFFEPDTEAAG